MQDEILKKAISTFGESHQIDRIIEECSELIQALSKYKRALDLKEDTVNKYENVIEEIADVKIVTRTAELIFNEDEAISKIVDYKLERLKKRMEERS